MMDIVVNQVRTLKRVTSRRRPEGQARVHKGKRGQEWYSKPWTSTCKGLKVRKSIEMNSQQVTCHSESSSVKLDHVDR